MLRALSFSFAILLTAAGVARAATSDLTPEQLATESRACRERAKNLLLTYDEILNHHAAHARFVRPDLPKIKADYVAQSERWNQLADAYAQGNPTAIADLRAKTDAGNATIALWKERLDAREKEAEVAPSETKFLTSRIGLGPLARDALANLIEVKKDAADAWCLVAEATVPGVEREHLADLREKANLAASEVDIATTAFEIAQHRDRFVRDAASLADPKVDAALARLRELDDQRLALQRDDAALAARARDNDRRRTKLEADLKQAIEEAK
jgi:hypothetical protein